jgi:predicted MPP superfamily phosphohydrolase
MVVSSSLLRKQLSRRRLLKGGLLGAAGLALYSGEVARHWIEVSRIDIRLRGLPAAFDGFRIAQLSDIHMDEYTEPFFLRHAIEEINRLQPGLVLLTGDFVSSGPHGRKFAVGAAWQCANILRELACRELYAILGNHDVIVSARWISRALTANGITVLTNANRAIERGGSRIWLAGLDDPVEGHPDPEKTIPPSIRNVPNEPVVLMCHAPDYADYLLAHPAGQAVDLMLSGHTHGGQFRLPLVGPLVLPSLGQKYVQGWFQLGGMQLYVNRGLGTVGLPFRLNCPPEITLMTLRRG